MDFRTDKLLHGGDYNPEQWLKRPDILEKDIDMLEESGKYFETLFRKDSGKWSLYS